MEYTFNQPLTSNYSVHSLIGFLGKKIIDIDVPYQRKIVWSTAKQMLLLDSLLRGIHIPVFLFNRVGLTWRCIDGKQRLTSIQNFFEGKIGIIINGKLTYCVKAENQKKNSVVFTDLEQIIADKFLTVVMYYDLTDDMEREIFARIQNGTPLNSIEKINALDSPIVEFAKEMCETYYAGSIINTIYSDKRLESLAYFLRVISITYGAPYKVGYVEMQKRCKRDVLDVEKRNLSVILHLRLLKLFEMLTGKIQTVEATILAIYAFHYRHDTDGVIIDKYNKAIEIIKRTNKLISHSWLPNAIKLLQ